jgi:uncharacterized protein (DUF1330 family)
LLVPHGHEARTVRCGKYTRRDQVERKGRSVSITPTESQLAWLAAESEEQPVVMLNLLRFKETADRIDAGLSGREAYARYGHEAAPFLARAGGRVLLALEARQMVIGPEALEWDMAILVEYPSRKRFLTMASDPDYLQIHEHRDAGLADSRLIACSTLALDPSGEGGTSAAA